MKGFLLLYADSWIMLPPKEEENEALLRKGRSVMGGMTFF